MYKYEMDPARTVGATERKQDAVGTDGRSETNILPDNFAVPGGYNYAQSNTQPRKHHGP